MNHAFHYHSSLIGSNVVNTVIRYWPPLEIHAFGAIVLLGMLFHKQASNSVLSYLHQHFSTNNGNRRPRLSFRLSTSLFLKLIYLSV